MKRVLVPIVLAWAMFAGGCVFVAEHHGDDTQQKAMKTRMDRIAGLETGSAYDQVLDMLGTPDAASAYPIDGKECRVLEYRVGSSPDDDGKSYRMIPLVFEDGKLVGWGERARHSCQ